jgi:L-seryl-tRNA(Ser) seleniumtransferase
MRQRAGMAASYGRLAGKEAPRETVRAMSREAKNPFRLLPAVEEVLRDPDVARFVGAVGREVVTSFVQEELERWRAEIHAGGLDAEGLRARLQGGGLLGALAERVRGEEGSGLVRAVNATGVVLHTGLGRAPVHPEAAAAMEQAARSYVVLEVDRRSGARGRRDDRVSVLLGRLTGAEAALAVNNNAAAVVLLLSTFAAGRAAVVSRGELVEIGGSFRMPDVMESAGVRLAAVGTTNRTRAADYRAAAAAGDAALLLKVHPSNFALVGFTEEVDPRELAALGQELGIATAYDLGSGLLEPPGARPLAADLGGEPLVRQAVASGVDVVTFSGDKLLGGPQAGLLAGKRAAIERLRKNPLYRALRLDKVGLAGLEATLELYLAGRGDEVPARAMLAADPAVLAQAAAALAEELGRLPGFAAQAVDAESQPGSGSAPTVLLPTRAVAVTHASRSVDDLARALRTGEPAVFARIAEGRLLLDPRTLLPGDDGRLLEAFRRLAGA